MLLSVTGKGFKIINSFLCREVVHNEGLIYACKKINKFGSQESKLSAAIFLMICQAIGDMYLKSLVTFT